MLSMRDRLRYPKDELSNNVTYSYIGNSFVRPARKLRGPGQRMIVFPCILTRVPPCGSGSYRLYYALCPIIRNKGMDNHEVWKYLGF